MLSFLSDWRDSFVEKHLWMLLPVFFFIVFIPENSTGITNLYRALIVLPLLFCIRAVDVKALWENTAARWMILLCGWGLISLFFDGYTYKDLKLFWRLLNVAALFYLIFLYYRYHSSRGFIVQPTLLLLGVIGVVLILMDWDGLRYFDVNKNYYRESSRGIFGHHLEVGWVIALLGIVSLNQMLSIKSGLKALLCAVLLLFFAVVLFLVQARGGYVLFAVGSALLLLLSPGKRSQWLLVGGSVLLMVCLLLFREELLALWGNVLDRGSSSRYPIWGNGVNALTESTVSMLFGHGLSASAENTVGRFQVAHFHNFFINHTFYTGLIGLFLYCGLVFSALKRAFSYEESFVWGMIVLAMQVAFVTDGDRLIVNPSAMMLCFLLPLALASFSSVGAGGISTALLTGSGRKHLAIFVLMSLAVLLAVYVFTRDATKHMSEDVTASESESAVLSTVLESGVINVEIEK